MEEELPTCKGLLFKVYCLLYVSGMFLSVYKAPGLLFWESLRIFSAREAETFSSRSVNVEMQKTKNPKPGILVPVPG